MCRWELSVERFLYSDIYCKQTEKIGSSIISRYHLKLCRVLIVGVNLFNTETTLKLYMLRYVMHHTMSMHSQYRQIGIIKQVIILYPIRTNMYVKPTLSHDMLIVTWRDFGKRMHGSVCDLMKVTLIRFKTMPSDWTNSTCRHLNYHTNTWRFSGSQFGSFSDKSIPLQHPLTVWH